MSIQHFFEGCCDPGMGRLIGRRHPWCYVHQLQGSHVFIYFFRIIIKIPPWQGARRWPTREAPMLQGAEGGGSSWDHLWLHHPTSAGTYWLKLFNWEVYKCWICHWCWCFICCAVLGSSASDGVHKWNDCIHSVEEEGDRRGVWKAGVKNALRMTIHVWLK